MGIKIKGLLEYFVLILSFGAAFFLIKAILHSPLPLVKQILQVENLLTIDNKFRIIFTTLYYEGILIFISLMLVSMYRLPSQKNPVNSPRDPALVVCLNRIIGNTIQQSFVFFPLYMYWIFVSDSANQSNTVYVYPLLFLIGRVLFAIGYLVGTIIHLLPLRATGIVINFTISFLLLLETQGISLINKIFI